LAARRPFGPAPTTTASGSATPPTGPSSALNGEPRRPALRPAA
jgi:hypothetical protein